MLFIDNKDSIFCPPNPTTTSASGLLSKVWSECDVLPVSESRLKRLIARSPVMDDGLY